MIMSMILRPSSNPIVSVLIYTAIAAVIVTVLAYLFLSGEPQGKHRRPEYDTHPDWDDDDDPTGDGDGDDDDWAYELETMNQERAFAEANARHARGEYLTTTPGTRARS